MAGIKGFKILQPNNLVNDLVSFMEENLMNFKNSEEFVTILEKKKNENQHSLSFCVFMTNKCSSTFYFARENAQRGSSVIDIGVYKGSHIIFTIEAKLFPIPNEKKDRKEHEYVYGKGAGIQRFKDGKHGLDNQDNLLPENGLIAFIKEKDFEHWYLSVNQWILDANWDESEQLQKTYSNSTAKFISNHIRTTGENVKLHHFWLIVDEKTKTTHKPRKTMKVSEENKRSIEAKCEPLVEQFRERYILKNPNKEFSYLIDVHLKWYRHYLYFCEQRRQESPDGTKHREGERKFVRLECVANDRFNFSYFRHTGKWFVTDKGLTLDECFEMMKGNQNFHPM